MPASQPDTPMGANLVGGGATFRTWAPNATSVCVLGDVADTVARMREFYRTREPQAMRPVDMKLLGEQVLELTRARWSDMAQQHGVHIGGRTEIPRDLPPVLGVESELRDALTNLIFNAIDAMPNGGSSILRARVGAPLTRELPSTADAVQRLVQVEVADNGIGMDEETRRRCLEPFFTTKGDRGTGLGLAMVYGAVQRHNGDIEIDSTVGKGTTVRLTFAAATPASDRGSLDSIMVVPSARILLVDDDPLVLKSLQDILEADGHTITVADGGQASIDARPCGRYALSGGGHRPGNALSRRAARLGLRQGSCSGHDGQRAHV
jgi:Histidine kinase-, DNA gyrase B-, and HSP90-like ATPase